MTPNQCRCVSVRLVCRAIDADEAMYNCVHLVLDEGVQLQAALWMPKEKQSRPFGTR